MDHRVMRWKYPLKLTDHYVVMVLSPIVVACDEVHRWSATVVAKRFEGADRVLGRRLLGFLGGVPLLGSLQLKTVRSLHVLSARWSVFLCFNAKQCLEHLWGSSSNSWVFGNLYFSLSAFAWVTIIFTLLANWISCFHKTVLRIWTWDLLLLMIEHQRPILVHRLRYEVMTVKHDLVNRLIRGGIKHHRLM